MKIAGSAPKCHGSGTLLPPHIKLCEWAYQLIKAWGGGGGG
jgi:hypothetical protein